jgi:hypothetical protein
LQFGCSTAVTVNGKPSRDEFPSASMRSSSQLSVIGFVTAASLTTPPLPHKSRTLIFFTLA